MKKICTLLLLPLLLLCCLLQRSTAQCTTGYNKVTLNWDYLDYFTYSGDYTNGNGYLPSHEWALTQHFSFGTNRLTIDVPYLSFIQGGDNNANDVDPGDDVQFTAVSFGSETITLIFEQEVRNLQFSIYDLDFNQRMNVSGKNAAGDNTTVTLSKAVSNSGISLNSNPGNNPQARAPGSIYGSSDNRGTINIEIDGPVKTVSLTFSGFIGDFWLSDISACSPGNFPSNYYEVSRPISGQPSYVLHSLNNKVYALNPATGLTKLIFTDNNVPGNGYINSMAYDPYNRILYYTWSHTSQGPPRTVGGRKTLKKYNFTTGTISTVLNDITNLGIPVSEDYGVESGGAAFYNGNLYLGIEATNDNQRSDRESVIWRIDFDGSGNPFQASQVFAVPADNGSGTLLHHFGDLVINNGVLYDFDGATADGNRTDIYQFNLQTGDATVFSSPSFTPGQTAVDWSGTIYQLYANASNSTQAYVAAYNPSNGAIGTKRTITATPMFTPAIPELSDAAEAYRPASDYGDAPSSYSPIPFTAAAHETDNNLRLGTAMDKEWDGMNSSIADADGSDEDGIGAAPALNIGGSVTYTVSNISVYNNTGSNATLVGWLDYNFNGSFEAGEGILVTIPSSNGQQLINLNWNNIQVPFTPALQTFLRLRITSASNGMSTANMNGWFANGEVEDYPVVVGTILQHDNKPLTPSIENTGEQVKLLPNPAVNYTTVRFAAAGNAIAELQLIDNGGKKLMDLKKAVHPGVNLITLNDLQALSAGVYTVRIVINEQVITRQLVISR
jgi:hypothetical protein